GLARHSHRRWDYEPVLPWFGVFLVGMAAAQLMLSYGPLKRRDVPPALTRALWPGRHSLVIYLAHQPILIALFSAMAWLNR
ncbi:heparan-alpha-glucosaminide N-acetyltransferase domain-containing protein, partial [Pseudorhodobacter sp.]|uniref:heparan-alpha-glucosaminide N-acetyltransferase domain-containing protein n=1 Tax=Pseudorhodobacter sp. TaxID=1934400 RepID=UPI002648D732